MNKYSVFYDLSHMNGLLAWKLHRVRFGLYECEKLRRSQERCTYESKDVSETCITRSMDGDLDKFLDHPIFVISFSFLSKGPSCNENVNLLRAGKNLFVPLGISSLNVQRKS